MEKTIVYNKIGSEYNTTRKADPYIAGKIHAFLAPEEGKTYLDIGCGTGTYTVKLSDMGVDFIGIDPSEVMLERAKNKESSVTWVHASAEDIPLPDESVDGAIGVFTIHHWNNVEQGLNEIARVLKPGSNFVIFTFTPEQKKGYWFNYFFPSIMEKSFEKSLPFDTMINAATKAGLTVSQTEKYFVTNELQDMFGYCGKHNPEVYFDPQIRKGIYMFTALKDMNEEENGLRKLRECIDNGEFEQISKQYENENGDYLFVVLRKP